MAIDQDTKSELTEGEEISNMLKGRGWGIVKAAFDAKILDLQMIGNVTGATSDEKIKNLEARAMAVAMMWEWMKMDVYGRAEQHENNMKLMHEKKTGADAYIDLGVEKT